MIDKLFHFFINELIFLFLEMELQNLRNLLYFYMKNDKVFEN